MSRVGLGVLFTACAFTYVSPLRTPFDTQPYALVAAGLVVVGLASRQKIATIPTPLILLFIPLVAGLVSLVVVGGSLAAARSYAGYATLALVSLGAYWSAKGRLGTLVPWVSAIFAAVALIQVSITKTFAASVLPRLATSEGRGVTSLAPEPSIFAIECIALMVVNERCYSAGDYGRRAYFITTGVLLAQQLLAGSALALLLLLAFQTARYVFSARAARIAFGVGAAAVAVGVLSAAYALVGAVRESRFVNLATNALESPVGLIAADQSVAERAFALEASFRSLLYSDGLGYGLGAWAENVGNIVVRAPRLLSYGVSLSGQDRVMSGFGTAIFELGLIGLVIPFAILLGARGNNWTRLANRERAWVGASTTFLFLAMTTSMPLAFPFFGFIFGLCVATTHAAPIHGSPVPSPLSSGNFR